VPSWFSHCSLNGAGILDADIVQVLTINTRVWIGQVHVIESVEPALRVVLALVDAEAGVCHGLIRDEHSEFQTYYSHLPALHVVLALPLLSSKEQSVRTSPAFKALKMAELAPIPMAREAKITRVNTTFLRSMGKAYAERSSRPSNKVRRLVISGGSFHWTDRSSGVLESEPPLRTTLATVRSDEATFARRSAVTVSWERCRS
jgi:hypothetical protein